MSAGVSETREPKSVMAGIWRRGWWYVIGFSGDKQELEIQVIKDLVVDGCESVKLKLCSLGMEPFKEGNLIVMEVRPLKDIKVPLALLCVH